MKVVARLFAITLTLGCVLVTSGCGQSSPASVTGKVTYKGKTVVAGQVTIMGSKNVAAYGAIEPDGTYTVTDAPTGKVKIAVVTTKPIPPVAAPAGGGRGGGGPPPAPQADPKLWFPFADADKLGNPDTSGLEATISSGNNTHNIEIP